MTIQEFDNTGWKAGMQVTVGNVKYHVWRIDFGLKRVQVPVNNEITTNMLWLHCLDFEVVTEPSALDLIAAEREKQKITSINISITAPGGDVLYSTANNAMFSTVTQVLRDFKKDLKNLITEDPERFKNVII